MESAGVAQSPTKRRRWYRWPLRVLLALLAPFVAYAILSLTLGAIPTGHTTPGGADTIPIYLCSNGVHVDFVVPIVNDVHDWNRDIPARDFASRGTASGIEGREWLAFGWGDKRFFLETKTWSDLRVPVALQAMFWLGTSAMHVECVYEPDGWMPSGKLSLTRGQYRDLCEYIRSSLRRDEHGALMRIDALGYGDLDCFYEATGRYSLINTCNEWIGAGLRRVGARTGVWTPFDFQVLMHVERLEPR
jgi:uncharacterized protein (TIGR02117 family)